MATLRRLKPNSSGLYRINQRNLECSDEYKVGTLHQFIGTEEECEKLIFLGKKLGLNITIINNNTFNFGNSNKRLQNYFFKACRYVRTSEKNKILNKVIELIKDYKIKPFNAFIIAHLTTTRYFSYSLFPCFPDRLLINYYSFRSKNNFLKKISRDYNVNIHNLYQILRNSRSEDEVLKIRKELLNKNYKEVQKLMYEPKN